METVISGRDFFYIANEYEPAWHDLIGVVVEHKKDVKGQVVGIESSKEDSKDLFIKIRFNSKQFTKNEPEFRPTSFEDGSIVFVYLPSTLSKKLSKWLRIIEMKKARKRAVLEVRNKRIRKQNILEFPSQLQNFISREFGWEYEPKGNEYGLTSDIPISKYLGTYFPRSFSEAYQIFHLLFLKDAIAEKFLHAKELNILDIGSGTGGNIFGFLWLMKDLFAFLDAPMPSIFVFSLDEGNQALDIQNTIFEEFFSDQAVFQPCNSSFLSGKDFQTVLSNTLRKQRLKYDIIFCWKFVCEFYITQESYNENKGMYGVIVDLADKYLKEEGILVICDVTVPSYKPDGDFIPCIMNREIHKKLLDSECKMAPVFPLSCAHWYRHCVDFPNCFCQKMFAVSHKCQPDTKQRDIQGVSFKVLSKELFGREILHDERPADGYVVAYKDYGYINTCRDEKNTVKFTRNANNREREDFPDPFTWASAH